MIFFRRKNIMNRCTKKHLCKIKKAMILVKKKKNLMALNKKISNKLLTNLFQWTQKQIQRKKIKEKIGQACGLGRANIPGSQRRRSSTHARPPFLCYWG